MQLLDLFRPLTDFGLTNRQETDDSHWWWCREIKCIELSILGKNQLIQYYYYYYYFAHLVACTCFSLTVTNAAAWQDVYCALLHPPRLPTVSWQSQVEYDQDHRIIGITNNAVFVSSSGSVVVVFCAETQRATDRDIENATTTDENHCIHIIIAHIQIGEQQLVNEFCISAALSFAVHVVTKRQARGILCSPNEPLDAALGHEERQWITSFTKWPDQTTPPHDSHSFYIKLYCVLNVAKDGGR